MATLTISYYATVDKGCAGDPIKTETVTTSGTSAASGDVPRNAAVAHLHSDAAHYFTVGTGTPTAAIGNSAHLPANLDMWLRLNNGARGTLKIAAITV